MYGEKYDSFGGWYISTEISRKTKGAISISAVVFVLLSEMYPNNVRGIAMSIARLALWVGTYLIGQLTPWLLANVPPFAPAGTFFLFALMCIPYLLIMWKLVPETTGKSLEEIERWWTGKLIRPQPECRLSSVRCQTGKHQIFIVIVEQFRFFS